MKRKMKDSGIEWIGEIPEEWDVVKGKYLYANNDSGVWGEFCDIEEGYIVLRSTEQTVDGDLRISNPAICKLSIKDFEKAKLIMGDLLITKSSGSELHIGKTSFINDEVEKMNCCFSNFMQRIRFTKNYYPKYYYFIFNSSIVRKQFEYMSTTTSGLNNINSTMINELWLVSPAIEEQQAITNFLDQKVAEIDKMLGKTRESIEEYKKLKQSIITEAITKGLNRNVEMKESGIEWIGEIPKHWRIIKSKELFILSRGLTITKQDLLDDGISVINYGEIHSKYTFDLNIERDHLKKVDLSYLHSHPISLVKKGDIVFCDTSEDLNGSGNCTLIQEDNEEPIFAGSHTIIAKLKNKQNPRYIRYMLEAKPIKEQISSSVNGVKVYSITQSILKNIFLILPTMTEQDCISSFLDEKSSQIDSLISQKESLIAELEAYKISLIYECVTGKREVV